MSARRASRASSRGLALAVAWLIYFGVLQWSVVRFRVAIVLALTACGLLLCLWLATRSRVNPTPATVVVALLGGAACTMVVPLFSYLSGTARTAAIGIQVAGSLLAASALVAAMRPVAPRTARRWSVAALVVAMLTYAVTVAVAVLGDPAPHIDVWVTLQQASDALARGENFYDMVWTGSPGIKDAFTYLPWAAVLLAPGRWLAGDVRWALGIWMVVAALAFWRLAAPSAPGAGDRSRRPGPPLGADALPDGQELALSGRSRRGTVPGRWLPGAVRGRSLPGAAWGGASLPEAVSGRSLPPACWVAAAAACWVLLAPGTLTQVDQAWTEPLLLAGLGWWAVLVATGRPWWAVLPLALACASKQHLVLLLPMVMLWRPFGFRRTVATGALTGILVAPWFVASPPDFVHDTVTLLIGFHPIRFANTWYLLALNLYGVTLPLWTTGIVVLGALGTAAWLVWRRQPPLAELLRWLALVLLIANLVNKQAFYNQYWLSGALVALSLAAEAGASGPGWSGRSANGP